MFLNKNKTKRFLKKSIAMTVGVIVMLFFIAVPSSCKNSKKDVITAFSDRSSMSKMKSTNVETLVSDSGMVKYKMEAGEWEIFDKSPRPYWSFEKGIHLERFDSLMNVDAYIDADTAYYYEKDKLWELRSNVKIENVKGETFTTDLLFWDQVKEKVYSDVFIKIHKEDQIWTGYGFESDQNLEVYDIRRTSGIMYLDNVDK